MSASDRIVPRPRRESSRAISSGKPIEIHGEERNCTICSTRLSRYNPSDTCSLHLGWQDTASRSYG
jgi:hypothetical protein